MKRTGIFFPYMEGERLKDFPNPALEGILEKENVFYHDTRYEVMDGAYYLKKMPEELLAEVHTKEMIERVKKLEAFDGVIWSASGTVQASEMIFEGKIKFGNNHFQGKVVTYHDPCYLGRANKVYDQPREVLKSLGINIKEMPRNKSFSLCCGAGGGQMFKEAEKGNKEVFIERTEEAMALSPDIIVTACPFCMTMLTDGIKYKNKELSVANMDLAEMLAESLGL